MHSDREPGERPAGGTEFRGLLYSCAIKQRREWLFWAVLLLAALVVRLHALDRFSYWFDEILQADWLQGDAAFFWESVRFDAVHPPLDYLAGRAFESLHPADWARKIPDAVWGVAGIAALARLMARRAGTAAGALTAILLAFAPFHVRYSQELRPYALGLCLLAVSLLALDRFLAVPGLFRLGLLFVACLATMYALYLAAVALAIAAAALIVEDAFSDDTLRRRAARRFLRFSPLFAGALFLAYLPWWPVVMEAARRPPPVPASPLTWRRVGRTFAFFAFAPGEDLPVRRRDVAFLLLAAGGLVVAARGRGTRFLVAGALVGFTAIEALAQIHPHFDAVRRFLPAALALPAGAAVLLAELLRRRRGRFLTPVALAAILFCDAGGLRAYFRDGRQDWRPLARSLQGRPAAELVFTENQWSQICTAFYVNGPDWLFRQMRHLPTADGAF